MNEVLLEFRLYGGLRWLVGDPCEYIIGADANIYLHGCRLLTIPPVPRTLEIDDESRLDWYAISYRTHHFYGSGEQG